MVVTAGFPGVVSERIEVVGIVQGVGFRPFVHRVATELGITGQVGNDSTKVFIDATGPAAALDVLVSRLLADAPRLAQIEAITRSPVKPWHASEFSIADSKDAAGLRTLIPPDSAVCAECVEELFDPTDRRFGHAFITCTNCGPRFTIIKSLPYDRRNTTMAGFEMCAACAAEYRDPTDRRYHAQPIGCHDCGPQLTLSGQPRSRGSDLIRIAATMLRAGAVVAVKGLGGYHLACDATNDDAVERLRSRKHRPDKPFAVMVSDMASVRQLALVDEVEAEQLASPAAPIVLLRAKPSTAAHDRVNKDAIAVSPHVAPGNPLIGVMLPYAPLHHLLLNAVGVPLVMTSANRRGEPIATSADSIAELHDLYDAKLTHDRPIHVPCDDSVVRVVGGRTMPIRRARGYAPIPVALATGRESVLAVGGEHKNTFCVVKGEHAWVSQHIGDMENLATLHAFNASVEQLSRLYEIDPTMVAVDAHPAYLTSKWARAHRIGPRAGHHLDRELSRVLEVQHHHAHVAAIMAEHHVAPDQQVLGFAFDGTGYGLDGTIWGGEVLVADAHGFDRVAHLRPIPLPGGDAAIRNPNRVALAHLYAAGIAWHDDLAPLGSLDPSERTLLRTQLDRNVACVPTTSMGRLFDAVASLLGLRHQITYEAQAAIELEVAAADSRDRSNGYRFAIQGSEINPAPVLRALLGDQRNGVATETIAWRFHDAVASIVGQLAKRFCSQRGLDQVALSGGVFQNALLTQLCVERVEAQSLVPLTHHLVPPNDGGLALGQAFVAAHHISHEELV